jgi:hypothetical protein
MKDERRSMNQESRERASLLLISFIVHPSYFILAC